MTAASVSNGGAPAGAAPPPLLQLFGVHAGYGGGDVLQGITMEVPAGRITCVVGPNGAGKSTLLATISGLLRPRTGSIMLMGKEIAGLSPRQILSRGVVQVAQSHSLFKDMSVRRNVEMGAFLVRNRKVIAERYERVSAMFPIVAERARERAGSLSGGQQRLVEFARCLMLDPALVILDEPSMGLDPRTLRTVFKTIREMNREGRTILLVEQNARSGLRLADRGVVLENGRVRLIGSGREVLEHPEIGALYLGAAASG